LPLKQPCIPPFFMVYVSILSCGDSCMSCLRCDFAFTHLQISAENEDLFVFELTHYSSRLYVSTGDFKGLQTSKAAQSRGEQLPSLASEQRSATFCPENLFHPHHVMFYRRPTCHKREASHLTFHRKEN
jgi:hypothetical protein